MEKLMHCLPQITQEALLEISQNTDVDVHFVSVMMVEYIIFQMYQLAPLEVEEWIKLVPLQCANSRTALPELSAARIDLAEIVDMNNEIRRAFH